MKKRILAITIILAMIFSLTACNKKKTEEKSEAESGNEASASQEEEIEEEDPSKEDPEEISRFAEFVDYQYKKSIESSFLTMHIYYKDPEAAGFNMDNVVIEFGEAPTPENNAEDLTYYKELKSTLESFDRSKLKKEQKDEYDCLEWEINTVIEMLDPKYDYYGQSFAPPNSLDQNIISFLSSYDLRNEREVKDMVTLLNSIPKYVQSNIDYAKVQQEKELFMTDFDAVIEGCDDALSIGMDSSVLKKLLGKVDELDEISAENKETYKSQITEAFEKSYLPAFQMIKDAMNEMRDGYNNTEGFAAFPNGAEYYEIMLNYNMGLSKVSCDDIWNFLSTREEKHFNDFYDYITKDPAALALASGTGEEEKTNYKDYMELLEDVKSKMLSDHPEVKNLDYNIEPADEEEKLDEKNVAAYFVIPPVDGDHKQQMRVNPSNDNIDTLETYTTITHEGFPGHMYQYAYMYDNLYSDYLKTLGVDGNVEGYAVYSQYGSLDYLSGVSEASKVINALNSQISYIVYSKADIGINYKSWDLKETMDYLSEAGFSLDEETVKEIYDFLRCTPATYAPYGYGYELIAELREKAEAALGDKFDAKEFNNALLNAGPTPYEVVKRHINTYINNTK